MNLSPPQAGMRAFIKMKNAVFDKDNFFCLIFHELYNINQKAKHVIFCQRRYKQRLFASFIFEANHFVCGSGNTD